MDIILLNRIYLLSLFLSFTFTSFLLPIVSAQSNTQPISQIYDVPQANNLFISTSGTSLYATHLESIIRFPLTTTNSVSSPLPLPTSLQVFQAPGFKYGIYTYCASQADDVLYVVNPFYSSYYRIDYTSLTTYNISSGAQINSAPLYYGSTLINTQINPLSCVGVTINNIPLLILHEYASNSYPTPNSFNIYTINPSNISVLSIYRSGNYSGFAAALSLGINVDRNNNLYVGATSYYNTPPFLLKLNTNGILLANYSLLFSYLYYYFPSCEIDSTGTYFYFLLAAPGFSYNYLITRQNLLDGTIITYPYNGNTIALDANNNLYFTSSTNYNIISQLDPNAGTIINSFQFPPVPSNTSITPAPFWHAPDIVIDNQNNIWATSNNNFNSDLSTYFQFISEIDQNGVEQLSLDISNLYSPGRPNNRPPWDLKIDSQNQLYVLGPDLTNSIHVYSANTGAYIKRINTVTDCLISLVGPTSIFIDYDDTLYVANSTWIVQCLSNTTVTNPFWTTSNNVSTIDNVALPILTFIIVGTSVPPPYRTAYAIGGSQIYALYANNNYGYSSYIYTATALGIDLKGVFLARDKMGYIYLCNTKYDAHNIANRVVVFDQSLNPLFTYTTPNRLGTYINVAINDNSGQQYLYITDTIGIMKFPIYSAFRPAPARSSSSIIPAQSLSTAAAAPGRTSLASTPALTGSSSTQPLTRTTPTPSSSSSSVLSNSQITRLGTVGSTSSVLPSPFPVISPTSSVWPSAESTSTHPLSSSTHSSLYSSSSAADSTTTTNLDSSSVSHSNEELSSSSITSPLHAFSSSGPGNPVFQSSSSGAGAIPDESNSSSTSSLDGNMLLLLIVVVSGVSICILITGWIIFSVKYHDQYFYCCCGCDEESSRGRRGRGKNNWRNDDNLEIGMVTYGRFR